jgi:fermentation-respiration switch protein FrsA (DUF1100 family)
MTTFIATVLIGLFVLNGMMFMQQSSMIFFPYAHLEQTPGDWGLPYQDVNLTTADGLQLHGWYIPHTDSSKVLLFFHGNAGNISHRRESIAIFHRQGLNVFIIDYRGYGKSQGDPDETGLYRDADAAWQYLTQQKGIDKDNIIIFGRSLGGAVATRLASEVHPAALILESTFSSARDMARSIFPILSHVLIFRYKFNSMHTIKKINCPLLLMHSPDDEIIPFHIGEKLYKSANEPKRLIKMKGDHNNGFLLSQPVYEQALNEFIRTYVP